MFCFHLLYFLAVYRIYTSILFHGSLLHVLFNMMALVPLGSEIERIMGSVRLLYLIILLATSNALFHLLIALLVAYNPFYSDQYLMNECAIGFSGILFSMIVIETSLSGVQSRRLIFLMFLWNIFMVLLSLLAILRSDFFDFWMIHGSFYSFWDLSWTWERTTLEALLYICKFVHFFSLQCLRQLCMLQEISAPILLAS